jgi:hypothetical protein
MNVAMVKPGIDAHSVLAGAQFIDAFSVTVDGNHLDARTAAERMFSRSPRWVTMLLALRDFIVKPLGLTTTKQARHLSGDRVGMFPVLSATPERLVAGFDDGHLDFRAIIDVVATARGQRVTTTTVVLTHNLLGRVYLAIIAPFHRLIVRSALRRVVN